VSDEPRTVCARFRRLEILLIAQWHQLPKRLQQAAAFVVDHPDKIAFGTAARIAALAHIQPSTLVRFAKSIGYAGFSELQVFRSRLRDRSPDFGAAPNALTMGEDVADRPRRLPFGFADSRLVSLERLKETVLANDLAAAINLLAGAQLVYLLGQRRAYPVSAYLAYCLAKLGIEAS
jgi:DNA-binding MurR/RpiR family transcriptional regulator